MKGSRAFTMVDLVAVIGVVGMAGAVGAVAVGGANVQPGSALKSARDSARRTKDATHIRVINQALIIWGQNNNDLYPLPSVMDAANVTVKEQGQAKDTTGNTMSLLVFCGFLSTEAFVSPAEKNPDVAACEDYEFDQPKGTVDPTRALWDPRFSAELGPKKGHISYAHLQPFGERLKRWTNIFMASDVTVCTRGPEIAAVTKNDDGTVTPKLAKADSIALRLFGDGKSWSGHAAFNDNSVGFATDKLANGRPMGHNEPTYKAKDGKSWPDIWCYDEPDDEAAVNNYLGLFVKAGAQRADWKGAWD